MCPGGIWSGTQENPHPADVLGPDPDDGEGGGPLRAQFPEPPRGNSGGPTVTYDL